MRLQQASYYQNRKHHNDACASFGPQYSKYVSDVTITYFPSYPSNGTKTAPIIALDNGLQLSLTADIGIPAPNTNLSTITPSFFYSFNTAVPQPEGFVNPPSCTILNGYIRFDYGTTVAPIPWYGQPSASVTAPTPKPTILPQVRQPPSNKL
jgi:hypothetical protein